MRPGRGAGAVPYIAREARAPYDKLVEALLFRLDRSNWAPIFGSVIREVGVSLYGGPEETRYYKQNEFIGALSCMRLEWQHRLGLRDAVADRDLSFRLLTEMNEPSYSSLIDEIAAELRRQPDDARPGHLNYFVTAAMVDAVTRGWLSAQSVLNYIYSLEQWVYSVTTRPYEEGAIARNGDVMPPDWFRGR